ncbi:hypothetical protein CPB83DRAFT_863946 [Crepidotus variabilis]|uniref:Uncharacterized protein n=1 Tax=Crepidotus variabilis TaxID=179855 RepID=A0A9P6JJ88_9AGAR|nr:hypothetical protein CPB83DRAFT_863946 [Crepidotus variabilis]
MVSRAVVLCLSNQEKHDKTHSNDKAELCRESRCHTKYVGLLIVTPHDPGCPAYLE